MTPAKVLHVVTQLELGGAQRSTLQLLERLDRKRFSPALLSSDGLLTEAAHSIPELPVTLLPALQRSLNPLTDTFALKKLTAFIREGSFSIVHTHSSKAGILGRWAAHLAGVPSIVHTIHGFGFHRYQAAPVRRFYQWLERRTAKITDRLIAVSHRNCSEGLRLGIGEPSQYRIIRYGIESERFQKSTPRSEVRKALGLLPDRPLLGMVGCLKPQKAPLDFVQACHLVKQEVPEAQFMLVGDGVLRQEVEAMRSRLGLQDSLHLTGWRDDVPRLLSAMDVFALSSRWEGLPIACLEAMASGIPVVATMAGGIPEVVAHERSGLLSPIGEPKLLAQAAVRLLRDDQTRRRMGDIARTELDGEFAMERMVRKTERLYEELIRESKSNQSHDPHDQKPQEV